MEQDIAADGGGMPASDSTGGDVPTEDLTSSQDIGNETSSEPTSGQMFTVKVGGEDVQVSLDEALNGYMRTADYTQKTQALAAQRDDLTYAQQIAEALEQDPSRAIQALGIAYGVQDLFGQQPQVEQPPSAEPADEYLDPEDAFKARVEDFIAQQEMRTFESQVQSELAVMHQQFGEFNDLEVLQYAVEHGIPSVTDATKAFVVDRVMSAAQRQQAERQAQERKAAAPPVAGGHGVAGGVVQPGGTAAPTSVREALALAEQAHGMTL